MAESNSKRRRADLKDETGNVYGKLTVIELSPVRNGTQAMWLCCCDCGRKTLTSGRSLRRGGAKSCRICARTKHGHTANGVITSEYKSWASMINRCTDEKTDSFKDYGARGISFCKRWAEFSAFLSDMGPKPTPKHTIDRIDNDGNYEPSNCRWACPIQQGNNKRNTHFVTIDGRTMSVAEWCRELGMHSGTVRARISNGWTAHKALTKPPSFRSKSNKKPRL